MANIKNLEMADALSNVAHITIKNGFLGFGQKVVYEPTQSTADVFTFEYAPDQGERLQRLLALPLDKLSAEVALKGKPAPTPVGHHKLEVCLSQDNQFCALQLFTFVDFKYNAASDFLTFEGTDVDTIRQLF